MSNPQGPGKQRKGQNKAPQPHHEAAGAPGRSEHHQPGQRAGEQGHPPHQGQSHQSHQSRQSHSSHPSHSATDEGD
jgi:hypothetical protein